MREELLITETQRIALLLAYLYDAMLHVILLVISV